MSDTRLEALLRKWRASLAFLDWLEWMSSAYRSGIRAPRDLMFYARRRASRMDRLRRLRSAEIGTPSETTRAQLVDRLSRNLLGLIDQDTARCRRALLTIRHHAWLPGFVTEWASSSLLAQPLVEAVGFVEGQRDARRHERKIRMTDAMGRLASAFMAPGRLRRNVTLMCRRCRSIVDMRDAMDFSGGYVSIDFSCRCPAKAATFRVAVELLSEGREVDLAQSLVRGLANRGWTR